MFQSLVGFSGLVVENPHIIFHHGIVGVYGENLQRQLNVKNDANFKFAEDYFQTAAAGVESGDVKESEAVAAVDVFIDNFDFVTEDSREKARLAAKDNISTSAFAYDMDINPTRAIKRFFDDGYEASKESLNDMAGDINS